MKINEDTDDKDVIEDDEKEMISNVFDFSTNNINEVMTPRTKISSVSISDSLENILHKSDSNIKIGTAVNAAANYII